MTDSYQEYITRVILMVIACAALLLTIVSVTGYFFNSIYIYDLVIILVIDLASFGAILLAYRGKWKLAIAIPIFLFMDLGIYSFWSGLFPYTGVLATVTSLLLIGLLGLPRLIVAYIVWIALINNIILLVTHQIDVSDIFSGSISLLFMYSGIAFLQWLAINQLQVSLKKSLDLSHDLQHEITDHYVTYREKLKLFEEYQFVFNNLQNDVFRLAKDDHGEIILQVFEGIIANRYHLNTENIAGKKLSQVVQAESFQAISGWIESAFNGENIYVNSQIGDSYFTMILTPVKTGDVVTEVVGSLFDTTETTILEKESRFFEEKMRLFIDKNPLGVIELDASGKIVQWNHSATTLFGYSDNEMIGQTDIYQIILPSS